MKNEIKNKLFEEQLRKFKYRVDYRVNESPRYRPLVGEEEQFDNLPVEIYNTDDGQPVPQSQSFTNEAGDQEEAPKPGGGEVPPAPLNDNPVGMETPTQKPNEIPANTQAPMPGNGMGGEMNTPSMGLDVAPEVDDIQNDIIKHNIAAMQSIHDKLEGLDSTVQALNAKLVTLNSDVEEVREPTNSEKLMSKKNVSYPYYFNLNDLWSDNWFKDKRNAENERGVRELPDGSFIADFDDLPQTSKQDVQNSFNDFN